MTPQRWLSLLSTTVCALVAVPAAASASAVQQASSENWSGYVVGGASSPQRFSSVSGALVQPTAKCTNSNRYAAFWVGLGGSGASQALEQAGTEADCTSGGQASYFAWYELVPQAPVKLDLAIHAGDRISSTVTVSGSSVQIVLADESTGQSRQRTLTMANPDTSSAEWIAEAPSACDSSASNCTPLALTDFGTIRFTGARTTSTDGHTGTISDSDWSAAAVSLSGSSTSSGPGAADFTSTDSSASAIPSSLSSDGSDFSVTRSAASTDAYGVPGYGGYGYGWYGGYGESYGSYGGGYAVPGGYGY